MSRSLLIILFGSLLMWGQAVAQCTPDTSITIPGLYPDSVAGLPDGMVGAAYNEVIQVRVLTDTTFNNLPVIISSITITGVSGLPPGISYQCVPSSCIFPGGGNGCILLTGTPSVAGFYPITVTIEINGTTFGVPLPPQTQVVTGYSITINQATGVPALASDDLFGLLPNYPNPAAEYTNIQFITPLDGDFRIGVYDILGKAVLSEYVTATKGLNTKRLNTTRLTPGIYMLSVSNGTRTLTRKMVVSVR
jgi:hypothetical protein